MFARNAAALDVHLGPEDFAPWIGPFRPPVGKRPLAML